MFLKELSANTVSDLLDFQSIDDLWAFMVQIGEPLPPTPQQVEGLTVKNVLFLKLAERLVSVGVDPSKSLTYAEAVLGNYIAKGWTEFQKLIQDANQELYCLIEDNQLARIFLRARDDGREFDIGAVKPVLLPTTRCEINVCRAIRPVVFSALK